TFSPYFVYGINLIYKIYYARTIYWKGKVYYAIYQFSINWKGKVYYAIIVFGMLELKLVMMLTMNHQSY
ncbi:hypothetical protein ACJX0J_011058, partial [Zea mays]